MRRAGWAAMVLLWIGVLCGLNARGKTPAVAILESGFTHHQTPNPVFFSWELDGALETLRSLGVSFAVLHDQDLNAASLYRFKLLLLPNCKNMTREEVQAVEHFVNRGGKVLATEFASYRDEQDLPAGPQNNFQLAKLFGVDYLRYSQHPPHYGGMALGPALGGGVVRLGRNNAIQVRLLKGSTVLAEWLDDDMQSHSAPPSLDAAIVENAGHSCIYAGENLFSPENAHATRVQRLLASLINTLVPHAAALPLIQKKYPALPALGPLPPIPASGPNISVMLPYPIVRGYVTCQAPFSVTGNGGRIVASAKGNGRIPFEGIRGGFTVSGQTLPDIAFAPSDSRFPLEIVLWHGPRNPDAPFKFLAFRGAAIFETVGTQNLLVNRLPLEDYLAGVVSHEVPFRFPMEALKTMAVVARTFALKVKGEKKFNGYDICATVACQAYDGLSYESARSREAVASTSGEVVMYHSHLADLPYHATCGGITEDIQNVWNLSPVPYLRSVVDGPKPILENLQTEKGVMQFLLHPPDSYCQASSRFRWKETYSNKDLTTLFNESLPILLNHPVRFTRLISIQVTGRTPHGRVTSLRITTNTGNFDIGKDKIRWLFSGGKIGLGGLQSTLFVILPHTGPGGVLDSITFLGGGWGHGVGLCQFGAEGMARLGFSHKAILEHYFPGTTIHFTVHPAKN